MSSTRTTRTYVAVAIAAGVLALLVLGFWFLSRPDTGFGTRDEVIGALTELGFVQDGSSTVPADGGSDWLGTRPEGPRVVVTGTDARTSRISIVLPNGDDSGTYPALEPRLTGEHADVVDQWLQTVSINSAGSPDPIDETRTFGDLTVTVGASDGYADPATVTFEK